MENHSSSERQTRRIDLPEVDAYSPVRATTGPLEEQLPWVLDVRIVGTPATMQVKVHEAMIIGRSDPQTGVFPDVDLNKHGAQNQGVSRRHAAIIAKDNRIKVKDLGSVNGTRLNGLKLEPNEEYRLRHGDILEVGQAKLQILFAVLPTLKPETENTRMNHASIPVVGSGQHVLIVEDDEDVGNVFKIALEHAGFKVSVADTAERALGNISHSLPDVIVLDLMLPDMSGFDLVRVVRKLGHIMPMIVCSGATGGFQMSKAKEAGADSFLSKPISVDALIREITSVIKPTKAPLSA
jgi:CheY-like chemotaxis protein